MWLLRGVVWLAVVFSSIRLIFGSTDTSLWVGSEYTPARASNELWWYNYADYEQELERELKAAKKHLGFNSLRMFLHNMLFDASKKDLLENMERFLLLTESLDIKPGFVFFDDCWNHKGANLTDPCQPVKGRHNGCWMASPQDIERTSVDRFQPYVTEVIQRFRSDSRVLFWEIFNEPQSTTFSTDLRKAGFEWAKAVQPLAPIMSCWNDNEATEIVDMHSYVSNFTDWNVVFSDPTKGGVVTEAGSRWYQGYPSDAGSTLMVTNWLHNVQQAVQKGSLPFVPGAFISWELMVGNSNTRWHWNSADGSPEPAIPWDAHLFPDGTPVSYTEAASIRKYTTGVDDFHYFNNFLPSQVDVTHDQFLTLPADKNFDVMDNFKEGVIETTVWLSSRNARAGIMARVAAGKGYNISIDGTTQLVHLAKVSGQTQASLGSFNASLLDCGMILNGWNMLRVTFEGTSSTRISIYFNPMWIDTQGPNGVIHPIKPRLAVTDNEPSNLAGSVALYTQGDAAKFDYVGVLPLSVLN